MKKLILIQVVLASALSGCGGDGGDPAGFDASPFYGVWLTETTYCGSNAAQGTDGTYYSSIDKFVKLTETQYEFTADLYQGLTCNVKVGTLTEMVAITYSAATITGKPVAARLAFNSSFQKTATLSNGSPIALQPRSGGTVTKTVIAIENGVIYAGDNSDTSAFDSDGYPTTVLRYGPKQ